MSPIRQTLSRRCASAASGANSDPSARPRTSPISRMGTSVGMVGGSLADDARSQEPHALVNHRPRTG
jgi:hypothetical protein